MARWKQKEGRSVDWSRPDSTYKELSIFLPFGVDRGACGNLVWPGAVKSMGSQVKRSIAKRSGPRVMMKLRKVKTGEKKPFCCNVENDQPARKDD